MQKTHTLKFLESHIAMSLEQYSQQFNEDDAVGWDAISAALNTAHPNQQERHYAPAIYYRLGGDDPLDGISIYDIAASPQAPMHRHIVSFGMSELYYAPESAENAFSGWGFEFTFRPVPFAEDTQNEHEPHWAMALMNNLARYVFTSQQWFEAHHVIPANGPIRLNTNTDIIAIAFAPDPQLGSITTPNGTVDFLQMVGLTSQEYAWFLQEPTLERSANLLDLMRKDNPLLITDLTRRHSYV